MPDGHARRRPWRPIVGALRTVGTLWTDETHWAAEEVIYARTMSPTLRFGFVVPWADAEEIGDLAAAAEDNGWDGLFVWEPVWGVDAWIGARGRRRPHVARSASARCSPRHRDASRGSWPARSPRSTA